MTPVREPETFPPIGIMGPAGHGKTTVARFLSDFGGRRIYSFADPIKDMLRPLGLDDRDLKGDLKETPHPRLCGKTPRQALQWLGTEWGRQQIGEDIWINAWRYRVEGSGIVRAIADDVRFPNEVHTIRELGGEIWVVYDPRKPVDERHATERHWKQVNPDVTILNEGDLESLRHMVQCAMEAET